MFLKVANIVGRVYPFPTATHTYFKVLNKDEERSRFLNDPCYIPSLIYSNHRNEYDVLKCIATVEADSLEHASLRLVYSSIKLEKTHSIDELDTFRSLNEELYGSPRMEYVDMLMSHIQKFITPENRHLWKYIEDDLQYSAVCNSSMKPNHYVFETYRKYFLDYIGDYIDTDLSLLQLLNLGLEKTDLYSLGWRVDVKRNNMHASVNHRKKKIVVGKYYQTRTRMAAARIAVHEVYGHALRGHQSSVAESEGFGILLEQLLDKRFMFRRSYRYLAASLAWGVTGEPITFRRLHEIIWRVMTIVSGYSPNDSKRHAFDECIRVFRGGDLILPGAVYLKDSLYFDANIRMWQALMKQPLQYNEFIDVIEGRRRLLS